ncbi:hypothetical protein IJT17_05880 [bacterium]|nr:hypothetical protein [bacterium]
MNSKLYFCSALLALGLAVSAQDCVSAQPALVSAAEPVLMAEATVNGFPVIVDFRTFYHDKRQQIRDELKKCDPNGPEPAEDSLTVWATDAMPTALSYSRDDGAWSQDIRPEKHRFVIPSQPVGRHGYNLRFTFVTGKGEHYAYMYFRPNVEPGQGAVLDVDAQDVEGMTCSRQITIQLSKQLMQCSPNLLSGKAKAIYEEKEYTVSPQGSFRVTVPFEPPQVLEVHYKLPHTHTLNIYKQNFAVTPESSDTVIVDMMDVADGCEGGCGEAH